MHTACDRLSAVMPGSAGYKSFRDLWTNVFPRRRGSWNSRASRPDVCDFRVPGVVGVPGVPGAPGVIRSRNCSAFLRFD